MSAEKPRIISNKVVVIAVIAASVLLAVGIWRHSASGSDPKPQDASSAALQIEVLDGLTSEPVSGAVIVIPEVGKNYQTDAAGKTEPIALPQAASGDASDRPWAEASVLIYKDGYVPYALFHVNAASGETREGPRVYLFPESSVQNAQPFSVTEGPPREWVNELVEQHRP